MELLKPIGLGVLFISLFLSCTTNELPDRQYLVITNKLDDVSDMAYWIYFSDELGNPLQIVESTNQLERVNYDLNLGTPFWVSIVRYNQKFESVQVNSIQLSDQMDTVSFEPVLPPDYIDYSVRYGDETGDAYINVGALGNANSITVGTNGKTDYIYNDFNPAIDTYSIRLKSGQSDCYISITDPSLFEPEYWIKPGVVNDETIVAEPADFSTYPVGFDIQLQPDASCIRQVVGLTGDETYCIFQTNTSTNIPGLYPVRYLKGFDAYQTHLEYFLFGDKLKGVSYWELSEAPLSSFSVINNSFAQELTNNVFNYSYSGNSQMMISHFSSSTNGFDQWEIQAEVTASNGFNLPVLPDEIKEQLPSGKMFNYTFDYAHFYAYSFLNSYDGYASFKNLKEFPSAYSLSIEYYEN